MHRPGSRDLPPCRGFSCFSASDVHILDFSSAPEPTYYLDIIIMVTREGMFANAAAIVGACELTVAYISAKEGVKSIERARVALSRGDERIATGRGPSMFLAPGSGQIDLGDIDKKPQATRHRSRGHEAHRRGRRRRRQRGGAGEARGGGLHGLCCDFV